MYLNALDNQVVPDSMLNCLPDNIRFDAKFKPGTNSNTKNFGVSNCDLPKGKVAESNN